MANLFPQLMIPEHTLRALSSHKLMPNTMPLTWDISFPKANVDTGIPLTDWLPPTMEPYPLSLLASHSGHMQLPVHLQQGGVGVWIAGRGEADDNRLEQWFLEVSDVRMQVFSGSVELESWM